MKEIRVSEATKLLGAPEVPVPEIPDEPLQIFEDEYYHNDPDGACRDIARLVISLSNDTQTPT